MDNQSGDLVFVCVFVPVTWPGCPRNQSKHGSGLLGALAAAPLPLLVVSGSDGAGQGHGADGAAGHLPAGHLGLDGWRRWESAGQSKSSPGGVGGWDGATWENVIESSFNVGGIQRWGLHEHEAFRVWSNMAEKQTQAYSRHTVNNSHKIILFSGGTDLKTKVDIFISFVFQLNILTCWMVEYLTCEGLGLLWGNRPQVLQVTLVSHQHHHDVRVCVLVQLLQPSLRALVGQVFADVVHQQSPNGPPVVTVGSAGVSLTSC